MARRRVRPSEALAPEHMIVPYELTAADMFDARLTLDPSIPDAVKVTPLDLLRYLRTERPEAVLSTEQARERRQRRDAEAAWRRARTEARRAGRPLPDLAAFLPEGVEAWVPPS